eukprot:Hpha_TRINITY_DN16007_c4_g10::TRINITY_DN16007_c4_g10_i1::g.117633::m.117633
MQGLTEEQKLKKALAKLEPLQIQQHDDKLDLPECLKQFIPPETLKTQVPTILTGLRSAYVSVFNAMVDIDTDNMDRESRRSIEGQRMDALKMVQACDAVVESLGGDEVLRQAEERLNFVKQMAEAIEKMPGDTEEERARNFQKLQMEEYNQDNPFWESDQRCLQKIARLCNEYAQEAGTELAAKLQEAISDIGGEEELKELFSQQRWHTLANNADTRDMFMGLLKETAESDWGERVAAVFLVSACVGAFNMEFETVVRPDGTHGQVQDRGKLDEVQAVVSARIEAITQELKEVEASLRKAGEFEIVEAIGEDVQSPKGGPVRQDCAYALGKHPDYVRFKDVYRARPVGFLMDGVEEKKRMDSMYYLFTDETIQTFDPVFHPFIRGCFSANQKAAETMRRAGTVTLDFDMENSVAFQPYILFLLSVCRKINVPFQRRVKDLVGKCYDGDPEKAKIKAFKRCMQKQQEDYSHHDCEMPSAAHLIDVVRCMLVCDTPADAKEAFDKLSAGMQVLRVKNSFAMADPPYGFRQILLNVLFKDDDPDAHPVVCEVQINLKSYAEVKHKIHRFYSIVRCTTHQELVGLLTKQTMPF